MAPLFRYVKRFLASEVLTRASALAFNTVLAIVPLVGLFFLYLHHLGVTAQWIELGRNFILHQLRMDSSAQLLQYFNALTNAAELGAVGVIDIIFLVYTAFGLLDGLSTSLDAVIKTYTDAKEESVTLLRLYLRRFIVMVTLPLGLIISLVTSHWVRTDSWLKYLINLRAVGPIIALPISWLVTIALFFFVYYLIPRIKMRPLQALKAAAIAGPALELMRYLFGLYSTYAIGVQRLYGALSVIPMFFLWVQFSWIVILGSALFIRPQPGSSPR